MITLSAPALTGIFITTVVLQLGVLAVLFSKAGQAWWKAFIPVYNLLVLLKIVGRKWYWLLLMCLPGIGFLFCMIIYFDILHCFGRRRFIDFILGMFAGIIYLPYVALNPRIEYIGPRDHNAVHKSIMREWAEAILMAVVLVVTHIKPLWVETYNIPSQSMEGTLLAGDYILVSKFQYGARLPMTPLAFPFLENIGYNHWYSTTLQLEYMRLPGFKNIEHGDVIVFNYPMPDDSPIDRKTNYIKRCIGLPGDSVLLENKQVFINSKPQALPQFAQFDYQVELKDKHYPEYFQPMGYDIPSPIDSTLKKYMFKLSADKAKELAARPEVDTLFMFKYAKYTPLEEIFPQAVWYPWNLDYFGPVLVPAKGMTMKLDQYNIELYERVITQYEGNTLKVNGPYIKINGVDAKEYTFKQDYYFVMGDNRENSADSRFWGFVPEDHIIGKAWFIWFSKGEQGVRYNRMFKTIE